MNPSALRERPDRRRQRRAKPRRGSAVDGVRQGQSQRGHARRQVPPGGRPRPPHGSAGPRPAAPRPAPRRPRRGLLTGHARVRLSGLAARRLRPGAPAPRRALRRAPRASRARAQRGAGRHLRVGQPARRAAARLELRRGAGHVVRQGARTRPRGRRAAPRQLRRRRAHRRRPRGRGRRPELQVVDRPERLRVAPGEPAHAGVRARRRAGRARPRAARIRLLACVRAVVRDEDRHQRRRRVRHGRPWGRSAYGRSCRRSIWQGRPYEHVPNGNLLAPASLDMERSLLGPRAELALAYARQNDVNRVEGPADGWLGIVAAGKSYYDLRHALRRLGLEERELERAGVRILKLGMIWPLEPETVRALRHGPRRDTRGRGEGPVRRDARSRRSSTALAGAPRIVGKRDERGEPLLPAELRPRRRPRGAGGRGAAARPDGAAVGRGRRGRTRRDRAPPATAADGRALAVLLLGLPAQQLHQGARGHARGRRHRLPHDGAAQPGGQGRDHRASRRWAARAPSGSAWRPSPRTGTSSRTSATAPSTTRARSRFAPPWPRA